MTSRTWFITGASNGLGRLLAEQALARGDRVVATARRTDTLSALQQAHGERLMVAALDVTDTAAIRAHIGEAFERMGRIDVVVSNAGHGLFGAAEELSDAQIERQLATNPLGSIQVIRAALPHLRRQQGGLLMQVSSERGQIAYPNFSLYHASKWGIEGFVESVAREVAPLGIGLLLVDRVRRARTSAPVSTTPSRWRRTTRRPQARCGARSPAARSRSAATRHAAWRR